MSILVRNGPDAEHGTGLQINEKKWYQKPVAESNGKSTNS